jgi:ABC-2 type transport system ATP-binding protein
MKSVVNTNRLTKRYQQKVALSEVSLTIDHQRVVGLIGQNGSGKTTLLDIIAGTILPSEGICETLGQDVAEMNEALLGQLGVVYQENKFLDWMTVEQHLAYWGSFYPRWDVARQNALLKELELDRRAKVGHLSGGDIQKLGVITAVSHHPRLLLLDEPVASLDPIARESLLRFILRLLDEDEVTIIVSSHALRDIERLVDWVICLSSGHVRANSPLDVLQERFAEWHVVSADARLPASFRENFIRDQTGDARQARLLVENAAAEVGSFRERYHADVHVAPLSLERIYPILVKTRA